MTLLQFPLRGPERNYETTAESKFRTKPKAKRVELTVPLQPDGKNYSSSVEDSSKQREYTLRSAPTTSLPVISAWATLRDNKLLLMPIDRVQQLRPHFTNPDASGTSAKEETKVEQQPELQPVQMNVKKRETERQARRRLNSYAHISQQEADEEWTNMSIHGGDTTSNIFWDKLAAQSTGPVPMSLNFVKYMDSEFPSTLEGKRARAAPPEPSRPLKRAKIEPNTELATAAGPPTHPAAHALQNGVQHGGSEEAEQPPLSAEETKLLSQSMTSFFLTAPVVNVADIRNWLTTWVTRAPARKAKLERVCRSSDAFLRSSLQGLKITRQVGPVFVHIASGNEDSNKFRKVVVDLFEERKEGEGGLKKGEVIKAVEAAGLEVSDTLYGKLMKEICVSRGASWKLKTGSTSR